MSTKNTNIRDLFAITQGMDKVSHESFISQEYNAFDWPRFFFQFANTAYRALFNKSSTKIENVALLINIFTGKLTTCGQMLNYLVPVGVAATAGTITQAVGAVLMAINNVWSVATGELGKDDMDTIRSYKELQNNKGAENPYYKFIFNVNSVDFLRYEDYRTVPQEFKKSLEIIKKDICRPIAVREMTIGEKNALKLWRPEAVKKDIDRCLAIVEKKTASLDDATKKKWNQFYKDLIAVSQDAAKYIDANTTNDF